MQSKITNINSKIKCIIKAIKMICNRQGFIVIGFEKEKEILKYNSVSYGLLKEEIILYTDIFLCSYEETVEEESAQDANVEATLDILNNKNQVD